MKISDFNHGNLSSIKAMTSDLSSLLISLDFLAPDEADMSYLVLPNGNRLVFCDVNGPAPRINLYAPNRVQIWHVAVHRLPVSIISAILRQAIQDNQ